MGGLFTGVWLNTYLLDNSNGKNGKEFLPFTYKFHDILIYVFVAEYEEYT